MDVQTERINQVIERYFRSDCNYEQNNWASMLDLAEYAVAGRSISHHHHRSTWQRTELQRVYGDTRMMETDWATWAYGDTGVEEMD